MKKTYLLNVEGKHRDRLLDAAKHDIRKYMRREKSKPLPVDVDFWDFDCRIGVAAESAQPVHVAELMRSISLLTQGADQFYVEVLASHGKRQTKAHDAPPPLGEGEQ